MSRYLNYFSALICALPLLWLCSSARAQVTYTSSDNADAFLATGSPGNPEGSDLTGVNFGGAGILVVAPAASAKGEFQSILKFNVASAVDLFNTTYGTNQWTITGITLTLTSNYGTAGVQPNNTIFPAVSGGSFVIEWLSNDDWVEGTGQPNLPTSDGVTYDSLPSLLSGTTEILGTNVYVPPGNNVPVTYALPLKASLVTNVLAGGDVSLLFYAADNQIGYLFNAWNFGRGNEPLIKVTAALSAPSPVVLSGYFTNGLFHLSALVATNVAYQIQVSPDLSSTNWQTLATVPADGTGRVQFSDPATQQSRRFYRLSY